MTSQTPKQALREEIRARLGSMSAAQRAAASEQACALLKQQRVWTQARTVLFFAPMPGELDLWPLFAEALDGGKSVGLPRFCEEQGRYVGCEVQDVNRELARGRFGIREPGPGCRPLPFMLDLVLVPGVAFDIHGRRLGRGKGFYDQMLADLCGQTCGVGFDEQIVAAVPFEPHDIRLNCLLTPTRWLEL